MNILGVRLDPVDINQATDRVLEWVRRGCKHYIVTTNIEFIVKAQKDLEFKKILNQADLSISDSSRLDWSWKMQCEKNLLKKLLLWPLFLAPNLLKKTLPTTTGVDLMENLCKISRDRGFRVGLLGGQTGVAEKLKECLRKKYPGLEVSYANSGGRVNSDGIVQSGETQSLASARITKSLRSEDLRSGVTPSSAIHCDILFVAFGAPKQEKWIAKNMKSVDAKVFMGVGGAFDYLSGLVPRAPQILRSLGLEWLFRLIIQPWRVKRFRVLLVFIFKVLWS